MKTYVSNKKVNLNYEILEKFEGGLSLLGQEVKSVKNGQGSLEGAYVIVRGDEVFLSGADIPPYQVNNTPESYDSKRVRKILVTKKEVKKIAESESKKGLTIVPISLYNKGNKVKISFAIARGKKKHDKRETLKKREADRDIRRTLKNQ